MASFFVIVLGYCVLIEFWRPPIIAASSQWALNRIQAERYVYSPHRRTATIVGSSLAFNLPDAALGERIFNLSLAAVGPLTGLEIVERGASIPEIVVIEINFLFGATDREFVDQLYAPPLYQVRSIARGLRSEFQPVNLVLSMLRRAGGQTEAQRAAIRADPKVVADMVAVHERDLSRSAEQAGLAKALRHLDQLMSRITKRGVKVVFLEMPVHPRLHDAVLARSVRDQLLGQYPRDRYQWLMLRECGEPETTDGLHLTYAEATRYAGILRDQLFSVRRGDGGQCNTVPRMAAGTAIP